MNSSHSKVVMISNFPLEKPLKHGKNVDTKTYCSTVLHSGSQVTVTGVV